MQYKRKIHPQVSKVLETLKALAPACHVQPAPRSGQAAEGFQDDCSHQCTQASELKDELLFPRAGEAVSTTALNQSVIM